MRGARRTPERHLFVATFALLAALAIALPPGTQAEQASQPGASVAGQLDVSGGADDNSGHTCTLLGGGSLRCWGFGGGGRLGYGNTDDVGDDETPGAVAPVSLPEGRTAQALATGAFHTCALLDDATLRCWGFGGEGRLGYASQSSIGDDEAPGAAGAAGAVDVGGRVTSVSAGGGHTCAVLVGGSVRCWGFGGDGRLGYGNAADIGDDEAPRSAEPVALGGKAAAISTGQSHTCALLEGGSVRCWGFAASGQLGYGNNDTIGQDEKPDTVGPVELGGPATAISAGDGHTCALLVGGSVRCWGFGGNGRLGYQSNETVGDDEKPVEKGPVDLGGPAKAISAGDNHTCALLVDGSVRCWGFAANGRLGYGNTNDVGDDETPGSVGPVDIGTGRVAAAISAGGRHTCVLLDDAGVRCWGEAGQGRLGYCNENDIGDDETPGSIEAVNITGSSDCPAPGGGAPAAPEPAPTPTPVATPKPRESRAERRLRRYRRALAAQSRRRRALVGCRRRAARRHPRPIGRMRVRVRRRAAKGRRAARVRCVRRYGRRPGRVRRLETRERSRTRVVLSFRAPGTHGRRPPAARTYLIKQSLRPIRGERAFRRAPALCRGRCGFKVRFVGARIRLTVTALRPQTTYYYSVAARDNVSGRLGPRSPTVKAKPLAGKRS